MKEGLENLQAGDKHYKAYVGPPLKYDLLGALQFMLLTACGLRAKHRLCDIGCGSLRGGKMLIPYLNTGNYFGLEPNDWLVQEGIEKELGLGLVHLKKPSFTHNFNFDLNAFSGSFDFLIAQSIFSHACAAQIAQCLTSAKAKMKPSSLFLATFVEGAEDYKGQEWVYPGCVEFSPQGIKEMAKKVGLVATRTNWPHPNGQTWYLLHFSENQSIASQKAIFNLEDYVFTPPPSAPEPSFLEKVMYNLKLRLGLLKK